MDTALSISAKDIISPIEATLRKRHYVVDFNGDSWDIRFTLEKPRAYIIVIMAVVGLFQLASHKTIFGTISLACAFLAVFAYQAGVKAYNLVNIDVDRLTITPEGITEYLKGNNGTRQYRTHQVTSIFTKCIPEGNRFLVSVNLLDTFGDDHPMITFRTKNPADEHLAENIAMAIKSSIGFKGV
jgi:hypothetical protein